MKNGGEKSNQMRKDVETAEERSEISQGAQSQRGVFGRLMRIGGGIFLTSITNILTWFLIGFVLGNAELSEVYSLTYPMQFVSSLIVAIFGSGANIKKEKEQNQNSVGSAIVFGFVISAIVAAVCVVFADGYITFFGFEVEIFKTYVIYFFLLLFVQTNFNIILQKLYFEDKEKLANLLTIVFNIVNFALVILISWITKNFVAAMISTVSVLFLFTLAVEIWQFKKFKLDFNILSNFKYESTNIVAYLFLFSVYFFGFQTIFSMGEEYTLAVNFVTLCTDAQWDCLTAIATVTMVDISKGRLQYKTLLKNSIFFAFVVNASILAMFFGLFSVYGVNISIGLVYVGIQIVDIFLWTFVYVMFEVVQLQLSFVLNTAVYFVCMLPRVLISCLLPSPYCTEIAQFVFTIVLLLFYVVIRFCCFKISDGRLVCKFAEKGMKKEIKNETKNGTLNVDG